MNKLQLSVIQNFYRKCNKWCLKKKKKKKKPPHAEPFTHINLFKGEMHFMLSGLSARKVQQLHYIIC